MKISRLFNNQTYQNKYFNRLKTYTLVGLFGITFSHKCSTLDTFEKNLNNYELSEGNIKQFLSHKKAYNYALNKVSSALNKNPSYEVAIFIGNNTNSIKGEYKGDSSKVIFEPVSKINKHYKENEPMTLVHGHCEEKNFLTPNFSFTDFKILNSNKEINSIVVVTKQKETFVLKKKKNFKQINNEDLKKLNEEYENTKRKFIRLDFIDNNNKLLKIDLINWHNFWISVAKRYNLEYSSNYAKKYIDYNNIEEYTKNYTEKYNKKIVYDNSK